MASFINNQMLKIVNQDELTPLNYSLHSIRIEVMAWASDIHMMSTDSSSGRLHRLFW